MSDLETLSAKKLHEVIARRDVRYSELLHAGIQAGLGSYRHSDMVELAKASALNSKLAYDFLNARHDWNVACIELDRRKAYHGGDKPIKRPF